MDIKVTPTGHWQLWDGNEWLATCGYGERGKRNAHALLQQDTIEWLAVAIFTIKSLCFNHPEEQAGLASFIADAEAFAVQHTPEGSS